MDYISGGWRWFIRYAVFMLTFHIRIFVFILKKVMAILISVIKRDESYSAAFPRCEHIVSHSGTGLTARPTANCKKRACIDFNGAKLCQQHAGAMALSQLMREQFNK